MLKWLNGPAAASLMKCEGWLEAPYLPHLRARLDACVHLAQAPEMQHHGDWLPV
jgi:hypothetical protein